MRLGIDFVGNLGPASAKGLYERLIHVQEA